MGAWVSATLPTHCPHPRGGLRADRQQLSSSFPYYILQPPRPTIRSLRELVSPRITIFHHQCSVALKPHTQTCTHPHTHIVEATLSMVIVCRLCHWQQNNQAFLFKYGSKQLSFERGFSLILSVVCIICYERIWFHFLSGTTIPAQQFLKCIDLNI